MPLTMYCVIVEDGKSPTRVVHCMPLEPASHCSMREVTVLPPASIPVGAG